MKTRRAFLRDAGTGALAFWIGGNLVWLTPAEAREQEIPFRVLNATQARTLEAFAETLLPGSAVAGIAHFIDHQLAAPVAEQLLTIRYLGVEPPFNEFYAGGLAGLDASAKASYDKLFVELDAEEMTLLASELARANPAGWVGPPSPFFFFVLRSDVQDVVYGTKAGVESLGIPYMAHIEPPSRWGET